VQECVQSLHALGARSGCALDHFGPGNYARRLIYNWDPATGNVVVPQECAEQNQPALPRQTIKVVAGMRQGIPSLRNFNPSWGSPTVLSVRKRCFAEATGFSPRSGPVCQSAVNGPSSFPRASPTPFKTGAAVRFPAPFPAGAGTVAVAEHHRLPGQHTNGRIHQFNFSVERQVKDIGIRLSSWARATGHETTTSTSTSRSQPDSVHAEPGGLNTQFVGATIGRNDGALNYNASPSKPPPDGPVNFDAALDLDFELSNYQNIEDPYAPPAMEPRSVFVEVSRRDQRPMVMPYPDHGKRFLTNAPRAVDFARRGWAHLLGLDLPDRSSFFTLLGSRAWTRDESPSAAARPASATGNLPADKRTLEHWFDATAFTVPAAGHSATPRHSRWWGPGLTVHNLSVSKNSRSVSVSIPRSWWRLQNLFNHPTLPLPRPTSLRRER